MIINNIDQIDDIVITLDSHYINHIAHALYWKKGPKHPDNIKRQSLTNKIKHNNNTPGKVLFNDNMTTKQESVDFLNEDQYMKNVSTIFNGDFDESNKVNHSKTKEGGIPYYIHPPALDTTVNTINNHRHGLNNQHRNGYGNNTAAQSTVLKKTTNTNEQQLYQEHEHPSPFTEITFSDIEGEIWLPVDTSRETGKETLEWCKHYTRELENKGNYRL